MASHSMEQLQQGCFRDSARHWRAESMIVYRKIGSTLGSPGIPPLPQLENNDVTSFCDDFIAREHLSFELRECVYGSLCCLTWQLYTPGHGLKLPCLPLTIQILRLACPQQCGTAGAREQFLYNKT